MSALRQALGDLPVSARLDEILAGVAAGNLVITAEPGAGKTTAIPPALLEVLDGSIVVAQPRRIAARFAARRVAELMGCRVGDTVGYRVRFDRQTSAATRLTFVTEGLLMQLLCADPDLPGVDVVILDEFHERHLDADLALALLLALQERRPQLRIVVMSATLDAERVAAHIGGRAIHASGRMYPVGVSYAAIRDRREQSPRRALARAVARAVDGPEPHAGHVLVFLPGVGEIRACSEACSAVASRAGLDIAPLYGDLAPAAQDAAVYGHGLARKRLILSTNVAETSLTIDGVSLVIDSGLHRKAVHDPWTGVGRLELSKIARASATQRAGRAGRTGPGHAIRLYAQADHDRRPEYDLPEISRLDLADLLCRVQALDLDVQGLRWLDPPPAAALDAATKLLGRLGLLGDAGRSQAKLVAALPLHPRLAKLALEAATRGQRSDGARVAALLAERSVRRSRWDEVATRDEVADLVLDLETLHQPGPDADRGAVAIVKRVAKDLDRRLSTLLPRSGNAGDPEELWRALMVAFPDRIGALGLDRDKARRIVFAEGGSAMLSSQSVVHDTRWALAVSARERRQSSRAFMEVESAVAIEEEWIIDEFADVIEEVVETRFDKERCVVEAVEELRLGTLVLEQTVRRDGSSPAISEHLATEALRAGWRSFSATSELWDQRLRAAGHAGVDFEESKLEDVLESMCEGQRSFAQLRGLDFDAYATGLCREVLEAVKSRAPSHIQLPGGRKLEVHYEVDRPPWVASFLQDFFGMIEGPTLPSGEALVLHLRAPNRRDVQVSTDLAGFWERHYPDLRKQLMRRYPRHPWPEDPTTATPPTPRPRRPPRKRK